MTHAYGETWLDDAIENLGEAVDYAAYAYDIDPDVFMEQFIRSGVADQFGRGNPRFVCGLSGTELATYVLEETEGRKSFPPPHEVIDFSPEYWCGWILAYYQWYTGRSFREIREDITMDEMLFLYRTQHEVSEDRAVDTIQTLIKNKLARLDASSVQQRDLDMQEDH